MATYHHITRATFGNRREIAEKFAQAMREGLKHTKDKQQKKVK